MAEAAAAFRESNKGVSGLLRLDLGRDALGARLGLIDAAQHSIDIQSYLLRDDLSGNLVALRLAEAADRGVRVRLLMDDALTEPIDKGLLALDDHANIEVRVFNPFPRRKSRLISLLRNFNLLNRRMHNKSFTVDRAVSIVGGRNLADEYFNSSNDSEFVDEDLLITGPVVDDVAAGFEKFWNTPEATPMKVFARLIPYRSITEISSTGRTFLAGDAGRAFLESITGDIVSKLLAGTLRWIPAPAQLVMDRPEKIRLAVRRPQSRTSIYLQAMVEAAEHHVLIVSPYFVPQKQGVEFLARIVERGARVTVVTNSLASTNHSSVHAAYARYRKPLLRRGIELFELRPAVTADAGGKLTLHSKVACVDDREVFVGSFNLDPRSLYINTEMGIGVQSPELTQLVGQGIRDALHEHTYQLMLSETGKLLWRYRNGANDMVASVEPHTSLYRRLTTWLMSLLPIESQM